tara:strand:+ start:739 stop:1299 length:561 start_codon:yes stop_codon:yes gene_type:complete
MENSDLNIESPEPTEIKNSDDLGTIATADKLEMEEVQESSKEESALETNQESALDTNQIPEMTEPEYVYSLIESAVPSKDGFRKNISKRDFALWVLPIVAINVIRRFTSRKTAEIVTPYEQQSSKKYLIKGTETVYTNTKSVFEGKEKMRFFGFRFISIWVFPMAVTGAFMEFLFVGPLNGTNPFG